MPDRAADPPDQQVIIFARGVLDERHRTDFLAQLARLRRLADDEPGTLRYEWSADRRDPSVLWAHEVYADAEALRAHRAAVLPLLPALAACFREPPTPHRCAPLSIPRAPEQPVSR